MSSVEHLIIGAGPTGLGAAWRLATLDRHDWCLCEAGDSFGGLAGSAIDSEGFTWDYGGHVQHSHYDYFDRLMEDLLGPGGWISHQRESWVWTSGRFVPYPFQLNLHRLPDGEREECVDGLRVASASTDRHPPANFGEWIDRTFGNGIARIFMRPYNTKTWARTPEDMDWRWIGDRVARVDLARVLDNIAARRDDTSWGPNNQFRYPRRGGTGAVWSSLGERLQRSHPSSMRLGQRLIGVDTRDRLAFFEGGGRIKYRRLLTTMPLDEFVALTDMRERLLPAARALVHTTTHVMGVGLHGAPPPALATKCWMYFPDTDCPFYRVTVLSRYSPENVPDANRYWSLLVEVSESPERPAPASLEEAVLEGLLSTRIVTSLSQVHHTWQRRLEFGYPVPTTERDRVLTELLPALESVEVYSRGRFGAWKYEVSNQDHSLAQGVELVDRWLANTPERTLNDPQGVNSTVSAPR